MQILEGNGLIELAQKRNLINFDNLNKNEPQKDPFLEDEGFLPSDISGATTPKRTSSGVLNSKIKDRRDSHKAQNLPQEEDKNTGTQRLSNNIVDAKIQVPAPQSIFAFKSQSKQDNSVETDRSIVSKSANANSEEHETTKSKSIFNKFKPLDQAQKGINEEPKDTNKLFSKPTEPNQELKESDKTLKTVSNEPNAAIDDQNKVEDKADKPKLKSIFGPPQNIIEELKQCRSSNNSSPSFGESKNVVEDKAVNKPIQSKNTGSIFSQKPQVIVESPNEEEQAAQEDVNKNNKNTENTPIKVPEVTPAPFTKLLPSKPVDKNPFLSQAQTPPINLFGSESKSLPPLETNSEKSVVSQSAPKLFTPLSGSLFSKPPQQQTPVKFPSSFKQANNNDQEDVGMGGVTPPNQSPIATSAPKSFLFNKDPSQIALPIQGSGGSKVPSATPQATGSIFGKSSSHPVTTSMPGSIFSMGKSSNEASKSIFGQNSNTSQSGSLFMSAPSQGQPEANKKSAWSTSPFSLPAKQKANDGLFSEK